MTLLQARRHNDRLRKGKLVKDLLDEGFSLLAIAAALKLSFEMAREFSQW